MPHNYSAILETEKGTSFWIKVTPRASEDIIKFDGVFPLRVRVNALPVDGKANKKVLKLVAQYFNLSGSHVTLLRGEKSTYKMVLLIGISKRNFLEALTTD